MTNILINNKTLKSLAIGFNRIDSNQDNIRFLVEGLEANNWIEMQDISYKGFLSEFSAVFPNYLYSTNLLRVISCKRKFNKEDEESVKIFMNGLMRNLKSHSI